MDKKNIYEQKYNTQQDAAFIEACRDEFKVKPFYAQWASTYTILKPIRFLMQMLSAFTATAAAVFFVYVFCGSVVWGFVIGGLFMLLIEALKAKTWSIFFHNFLQFRRANALAFGFALAAAALSGFLSFYGAPRFVDQFSPAAAALDIDSIKSIKKNGEDSIRQHFSSIADTLEGTANKVHDQNNWKGKTTRDARAHVVALRSAAAATRSDSVNAAVNRYASMMMQEVKEARDYNSGNMQARAERVALVGFVLGWLTVLIELLVALSVGWEKYYKYRTAKEMVKDLDGGKDNLIADSQFSVPVVRTIKRRPLQVADQRAERVGGGVEDQIIVHSVQEKKQVTNSNIQLPKCVNCGTEFMRNNKKQIYCSDNCRSEAYNKRRRKKNVH